MKVKRGQCCRSHRVGWGLKIHQFLEQKSKIFFCNKFPPFSSKIVPQTVETKSWQKTFFNPTPKMRTAISVKRMFKNATLHSQSCTPQKTSTNLLNNNIQFSRCSCNILSRLLNKQHLEGSWGKQESCWRSLLLLHSWASTSNGQKGRSSWEIIQCSWGHPVGGASSYIPESAPPIDHPSSQNLKAINSKCLSTAELEGRSITAVLLEENLYWIGYFDVIYDIVLFTELVSRYP